jgi:hypothetical protein
MDGGHPTASNLSQPVSLFFLLHWPVNWACATFGTKKRRKLTWPKKQACQANKIQIWVAANWWSPIRKRRQAGAPKGNRHNCRRQRAV